jgi:hypothetical protein
MAHDLGFKAIVLSTFLLVVYMLYSSYSFLYPPYFEGTCYITDYRYVNTDESEIKNHIPLPIAVTINKNFWKRSYSNLIYSYSPYNNTFIFKEVELSFNELRSLPMVEVECVTKEAY